MRKTKNANGFGAAIRALREKRQWSQPDLAHASGLSVVTICNVENKAGVTPQRATLNALRDALQIDPTEFEAMVQGDTVSDEQDQSEQAGPDNHRQ